MGNLLIIVCSRFPSVSRLYVFNPGLKFSKAERRKCIVIKRKFDSRRIKCPMMRFIRRFCDYFFFIFKSEKENLVSRRKEKNS